MILGVGSDIIHIPRIAKAIENPRFVARVYTAGEIAYARGRGAGAAASFAARCATWKLSGAPLTDFSEISFPPRMVVCVSRTAFG